MFSISSFPAEYSYLVRSTYAKLSWNVESQLLKSTIADLDLYSYSPAAWCYSSLVRALFSMTRFSDARSAVSITAGDIII
jgi:hypothetical protein